jgi:hypothetical protein
MLVWIFQRVVIYLLSRERMRMRKPIEGEERHIYSPKPLGFSDKVGHVG